MSYMVTIFRASQEFEWAAWAVYDDAYRHQAAAAGHWQWSEVNSSLYLRCFTGKVKRVSRFDRCLSVAHKSEDCMLPGEDDPDGARRLKTIESAVVALTQPRGSSMQRNCFSEVCRKWSECHFRACKYAHRCCGVPGTTSGFPVLSEAPSRGERSPLGAAATDHAAERATSERPY